MTEIGLSGQLPFSFAWPYYGLQAGFVLYVVALIYLARDRRPEPLLRAIWAVIILIPVLGPISYFLLVQPSLRRIPLDTASGD